MSETAFSQALLNTWHFCNIALTLLPERKSDFTSVIMGQPLPNVRYLVQTILRWLGIEQSRYYQSGVTMKRAIFAIVLLMVCCFSIPIFAQQQDLQEVMNAINALGAQENDMLSKKDAEE